MTRPAARGPDSSLLTRAVLRRGLAVLGCLALVLGLSPGGAATADESDGEGLVVLGEVPEPPDEVRFGGFNLEAVHPEKRRMYAHYLHGDDGVTHIVEYDLRPEIPEPVRDVALPDETFVSPGDTEGEYRTAVDTMRERLLVSNPGSSAGKTPGIDVIDLDTLEVSQSWSILERLPGFVPRGITYSPEDDRVYLVGKFGDATVDSFKDQNAPSLDTAPVVMALDADDGAVAWVRQVPECQRLLQSFGYGALIARSSLEPVVYFACASAAMRATGVVAMRIAPEATQADAASFDMDFHPAPGLYIGANPEYTGSARFDPATDRFFLHSLNEATPGAFVFDGRLDAWVGFIASRGQGNVSGLNPGNGHFYMGGNGGGGETDTFLDVADGRATPLAQGTTTRDIAPGDHIFADPGSSRIFVKSSDGWLVVDDRTSSIEASEQTDYDALTDDVAEGPDTNTFFSGGSSGFGAATTLVGGFENAAINLAVLPVGGDVVATVLAPQLEDKAQTAAVSYGNRGLVAGDVENLDVASFDVAASARALTFDDATSSDRENAVGVPVEDAYSEAHCGEPEDETGDTDPAGFGEATVSCDRESAAGAAHSSYEAGYEVEGGDVEVSVGSSSFDTELRRDDDLGLVGRSVAAVRDVAVSTPQGSLSIGEILGTARTAAQGRTGTSAARWTRMLSGVTVRDADGEVLFGPASCVTVVDGTPDAGESGGSDADSCQQLTEEIGQTPIQRHLELGLPAPDVEATPKGAFAQVRETQADFLQGRTMHGEERTVVPAATLEVFMDGRQKSRLFTEFAALRSNSIYYIQKFASLGGGSGPDLDFEAPGAPGAPGPDGQLSPPDLNAPDVGTDEQLVAQLSGFLSTVDPSQLVDPPSVDRPAVANEPSGGSDIPEDTGGVSSPPGMSTATAPELGDGVDSGEPAPAVAAPADEPTAEGGDQAQASGMTGVKMLARSAADAGLVGGIWLLFLGAIVLVMRRASLLQLLRP